MKKVLGKPVGNDKERGKCTYVSKYGLEKIQRNIRYNNKRSNT